MPRYASASSELECEAIVEIKQVINCKNPKTSCKLKIKYKCTTLESSLCERRDVVETAVVSGFRKKPVVGTSFKISRRSVCSDPNYESSKGGPACASDWEFKEGRDCKKEEISSQDEFELVSKCQDIADAFESGKNVKDEIDSAVVRECVQKEAIRNQGSANASLFLAVVLLSKDVTMRETALKKFESLQWSKANGFHTEYFCTQFKKHYAATEKERSKLPKATREKIESLFKRAQIEYFDCR